MIWYNQSLHIHGHSEVSFSVLINYGSVSGFNYTLHISCYFENIFESNSITFTFEIFFTTTFTMQSVMELINNEVILEVITDNTMLKGTPLVRLLQKVLVHRCNLYYQHQPPCHHCSSEQNGLLPKSRVQCFSGSSVVQGELLGTFISSDLFVVNHLIMLDFHKSKAHRKAKIVAVILCHGVRFIGGKLVGRVSHGNWHIGFRSLKVQSKIMQFIVSCVGQRWCWTWRNWRVLVMSRIWSSRQNISLKGKIVLLNCLLNGTERIWWVSRLRHEGSQWCCRYGHFVKQQWTQDMTKS